MQVQILQDVHGNELKNFLRVATISNKTALCYFYIGTDKHSLRLLNENFGSGFVAENLQESKKLFGDGTGTVIDCIILDVDYKEKEVYAFCSFLKNRNLHCIPIIYNKSRLSNPDVLRKNEVVDDIIDLHHWQYDFYSKISFLKKSKEYINNGNSGKLTYTNVDPAKSVIKRTLDILLSLLLIVLLLPLFILVSLAIRIESKGPIFYNAKRAGRGFKIFKFYKFRTMEVNADKKVEALAHLNQYSDNKTGAKFFKISNDPRITKVGRFLRNTSLDELPQLFNVLKGDMSLVGNRPLPLYEAATLTTNEFVERFMAPAGITGLWQIKKRGNADMSTEERISLDILYVKKSNLLYDFWIMLKTPKALIQKSDV